MLSDTDVLKQIGLNFKLERIRKGLSQEGFAEVANVHTSYIGKIERGEQNLTVKKIIDIANSLEMPISKVFYFE
ncbi:helix-turn-helix transcriptional regulator [bacterium]|nr:helix-turn-helix transcriptional regulator [bacterium]